MNMSIIAGVLSLCMMAIPLAISSSTTPTGMKLQMLSLGRPSVVQLKNGRGMQLTLAISESPALTRKSGTGARLYTSIVAVPIVSAKTSNDVRDWSKWE